MAWHRDADESLPGLASKHRGFLPFELERELQKFLPGGSELGKLRPSQERPVLAELPVWVLRWTHDGINSKMVFGSGRAGDTSVYSLAHDFFCGRLLPSDVPPLDVIWDGDSFFSLGNRRLAAFKIFQALSAHEVVKVPCQIWHKENKDKRQHYKGARTTTKELSFGIGIKPHGELEEAWHLGEPLFRRAQEWCVPMTSIQGPDLEDGAAKMPSRLEEAAKPKKSEKVTKAKAPPTCPLSYETKDARMETENMPQDQEEIIDAAIANCEQCHGLPVGRATIDQVASSPAKVSVCVGPSIEDSKKGQSPSPSHSESHLTKAHFNKNDMADWFIKDTSLPQADIDSSALTCHRMPPGLIEPSQASHTLETVPVTNMEEKRPDDGQCTVVSAGVEAALTTTKKKKRGAKAKKGVKVKLQECAPMTPIAGPDLEDGGLKTATRLEELQSDGNEREEESKPTKKVEEMFTVKAPPTHPFYETKSAAENVLEGPKTENVLEARDSFPTQAPASSVESAESEASQASPAPRPLNETTFIDGSDEEDSFRSDAESDYADIDADEADEAAVTSEYARLQEVEAEMKKQSDIQSVSDLKGRLVAGTFRVLSGSDFKGRRSKAQIVIDQGPTKMLGCRVHIIGSMNRKRAWDHDRCWVRILAARVATEDPPKRRQQNQDMNRPWEAATAQVTTLFGHVVLSKEQFSPRQTRVVCARSRIVRSTKSLLFRPINGKFPMIHVPWNPQRELPDLDDLHVIGLRSWAEASTAPTGMYEEVLNMKARDTDESVLYSIKRSLNYSDWEDHSAISSIPVNPFKEISETCKGRRKDLREEFTVCIEHPAWPGNMAISVGQDQVKVHVIDVTEYLSEEMSGRDLEQQARTRSCGVWLLDCQDQPVNCNLPLLQPEFVSKIDFAEGEERLALTFVFTINSDGIQLPKKKKGIDSHFESVVRCDRRMAYSDAEELIEGMSTPSDDAGVMLKQLGALMAKFETTAFEKGQSFPFEHWEPDIGLDVPVPGFLKSRRIVDGLSFLVNFYAAQILDRHSLWREFLSVPAETDLPELMPAFVYGVADTQHHRALERLLQHHPDDCRLTGTTTTEVVDAMRGILGQPHLSSEQRFALQKAFLRQIRMGLPRGFYHLGHGKSPWNNGSADGQLFHRPKIFHVSAPMNRYVDMLGQRLLKWFKGWRPGLCSWLRPTLEQMRETVDRTNARLDSHRFASFVMRQISHMRELAPSSKKVKRAVVGYVGPSMFEVLLPTASGSHFSMTVPTSAIRSTTCQVEFDVEQQSLRILNADPWRDSSTKRWMVRSWSTEVSCTISRNFAQPIKHHASANAMIISDISFSTPSGPVSLNIGHRMYPEVFSDFPDLKQVYLMEQDLRVYADTWYRIWRCRTHAAASEASAYTQWRRPVRLQFDHEKGRFTCNILLQQSESENTRPEAGDLVILRATEDGREAFLYGELDKCKPAQTQYKTKMCRNPNCRRQNCDFLHPGEEHEGAKEAFGEPQCQPRWCSFPNPACGSSCCRSPELELGEAAASKA
ncbi:DIS3-like exonuclease 2 (Protein SUPPRESSOR OF VARICOSE) [Durusdinium trenchii]|uniref:DIS3-like exonuclease 2 (Protein SUPPRESSOR OF VARICOSE) n=1 Tax=Durusdinium trenchii TaxID=1381693 RepID=A0ABP0MTF0_9DINO